MDLTAVHGVTKSQWATVYEHELFMWFPISLKETPNTLDILRW